MRAVVRNFPIWGCPQYNSNAKIFYFLYGFSNSEFTFKVHIKGLHSQDQLQMNAMEVRYARINFELPTEDCTQAVVQSWINVLEVAVNWFYAGEYNLFFNQELYTIGVSIPVGSEAIALLEVGAVLGIVRVEVVLIELRFENLWLSLEDHDTDVIEKS